MTLNDMEKINAYIERTPFTQHAQTYFNTNSDELLAIYKELKDPFELMIKAFELGRAKGFRAAIIGR